MSWYSLWRYTWVIVIIDTKLVIINLILWLIRYMLKIVTRQFFCCLFLIQYLGFVKFAGILFLIRRFLSVKKAKLFVHRSKLLWVVLYFLLLSDSILPFFITSICSKAPRHFLDGLFFHFFKISYIIRIVSGGALNVLLTLSLSTKFLRFVTKSFFKDLVWQNLLASSLNWWVGLSLCSFFLDSGMWFWLICDVW